MRLVTPKKGYKSVPWLFGKEIEIPEEWEKVKLIEKCNEKPEYGANISAIEKDLKLPRYIRITDLNDNGTLRDSEWKSITKEESKDFILKEGEILFARTGATVGKTFLYEKKYGLCAFAGYLIRFKPNNEHIDYNFLFHLTHSKGYWIWLLSIQTWGVQPNVNAEQYSNMPILLPPLPEQQKIATILSNVDSLIDSLEKLIEKKKNIKQGIMQELLTGGERLFGFIDEWETKELGKIVDIKKGQLITENTSVEGNIPVIGGGKSSSYYHNKPNRFKKTITISASGANAGYVSFHDYPIFASDCSTIEEGECYSIEYIHFQLQRLQSKIYNLQAGGAQPHVHSNDLFPLEIPISKNREEQIAIAEILSDMDSEIQELKQNRDKYIMIKQGMMQKLLTGEIRLV